ncbi:C-type lectin domain family 4 member A-like [Sorex araneus]|uniref:C-type lectin domain family 4 member A-like n=1 Tax=Sorex araneus TaxID=42254 RepID=UPI0024337D4B|nr:C-type lectin domain family 4 member A-like [Sorex araneus]
MMTEITYAEVRFINEAQSSAAPSEAPAVPKEKTCPPQSNSGCLKLLLAALLILLLLTISFLIAFIRKSWSCCPKNWKPFGSTCYFFSSETKNWTDSEKNCTGMQAHLLVVDSKEEQDFINNNVKRSSGYYLGLSDLKNGHWEWVNETPYNHSVTFWHPGEPSFDYEHCVMLNFRPIQNWGWNDVTCNEPLDSICEMLKIYL